MSGIPLDTPARRSAPKPALVLAMGIVHRVLGALIAFGGMISLMMVLAGPSMAGFDSKKMLADLRENSIAAFGRPDPALEKPVIDAIAMGERVRVERTALAGLWVVVGVAMIMIGQGLGGLRAWSRTASLTLAWIVLPILVLVMGVRLANLTPLDAVSSTLMIVYWVLTIAVLSNEQIKRAFVDKAQPNWTA